MHGKLLLLLAIALALLWVPTRERLEPTATIKSPDVQALSWGTSPYDVDEENRIAALVPGLLDEYVALYKQSRPTATTDAARTSGKLKFGRQVAYFYRDYYSPSVGPVDPSKVATSVLDRSYYEPQYSPLYTRLLNAYFFPTQAANDAIKVPVENAVRPYDDTEMARIFNLSPTFKTWGLSATGLYPPGSTAADKETYLTNATARIVKLFYDQVYRTLTRPVQASDIDTFVTSSLGMMGPDAVPGLKDLLTKYYMGGSSGPSGPSSPSSPSSVV